MTDPVVHVENRGTVRVLTLDDGKLNGLSAEMRLRIAESFDAAMADATVGAVVLTGAAGKFSAGGDIAGMLDQEHDVRVARLEHFETFLLGWSEQTKPILVAAEGVAAGGGVAMIAAADWAVVSSDARLVAGWPAIGLAPDLGAAWSLVRTLGMKRAYAWLLAGSRLTPDEARAAGLVSEICEPGQAVDTAVDAALRILSLPESARIATKRLLHVAADTSDARTFRVTESSVLSDLFRSDGHRAAVEAFLRRQNPS